MSVYSSSFRLSGLLIAAALCAGNTGALAQTSEDSAQVARASDENANTPAAQTPREHGRRQRAADKKDAGNKAEAAAAATEPSAAPFPAQPSSKTASSDLICKYDPLPGTKVKRKVCGTAEQWAAWRKKNEDNAAEVTRKTRENAGLITRPDLATRQMPAGGG